MGGKPQQEDIDKWPQDMLDFIEEWKTKNKENPDVVFWDNFKFPKVNPVAYEVLKDPFSAESESNPKLHI